MSDTAFTIRLPDDIAAEVERIAREDGVAPEDVLAGIAARGVKAIRSASEFFSERGKGADWVAFDRVFGAHRAGGEPPRPGDEIE